MRTRSFGSETQSLMCFSNCLLLLRATSVWHSLQRTRGAGGAVSSPMHLFTWTSRRLAFKFVRFLRHVGHSAGFNASFCGSRWSKAASSLSEAVAEDDASAPEFLNKQAVTWAFRDSRGARTLS